MIRKFLYKLTAVVTTGSLLLLTPGVSCYQVLAQEVNGSQGQEAPEPSNTNLGGVQPVGANLQFELNQSQIQNGFQTPDITTLASPPSRVAVPAASAAVSKTALTPATNASAVSVPARNIPSASAEENAPIAALPLAAAEAAPSQSAVEPQNAAQRSSAAGPGALGWLRNTTGKLRGWLKPAASESSLKFKSGQTFDEIPEASQGPAISGKTSLISRGRLGKAAAVLTLSAAAATAAASRVPVPIRAVGATVLAAAHHPFVPSFLSHAALSVSHAAFMALSPAAIGAIFMAGNIFAAAMALPEVLKAFQRGSARQAPLGELAMGIIGSAIFGLIIGPMGGYWGWALQNNYGSLTMLSILPIGWALKRGGFTLFGKKFWGPVPSAAKGEASARAQAPQSRFKRFLRWTKNPALLRALAVAIAIGVGAVGLTALMGAIGPSVLPPVLSFIASLFPTTAIGIKILTAAVFAVPAYYAIKWLRSVLTGSAAPGKKFILALPLLAAIPALIWFWPMASAWALPMTATKIVSILSGVAAGLFIFLFAPEVIRAMLVGENSSKHFDWRTSLFFLVSMFGFLIYWGHEYFANPANMGIAVTNLIENSVGGIFAIISFFLAWKHRNSVSLETESEERPPELSARAASNPEESPSDRAPPEESPGVAANAKSAPHVHEDFFGFRKVQGRSYAEKLPPLPFRATQSQIIDRISAQFNISRDQVLLIASQNGLSEASPAAQWLSVYDRLQKANYERFKELDHAKYGGSVVKEAARKAWALIRGKPATDSASFRNLANKNYAPGAAGAVQRLAGVHRHIVGFWVRFIYECFDSFILGYFRQAMSFHFKHSREDFLAITEERAAAAPGAAPTPAAESALAAAVAGVHGRALTTGERFNATPAGRAISMHVIRPFVHPLLTFLRRRLVMALLDAVAMGLLGALAPSLPFLSISVLTVPFLGPLILHAAHLFLFSTALIPGLGPFMVPVLTNAINALLKDLVLGPMLNTYIISFLMALTRRPVRQWGKTLASGAFWWESVKTFFGMMTIGAEIAGCLSYFSGIDSAIDAHGFYQLAGRHVGKHFHVFHALGTAVESPKGQSLIPFGGAITWGNALLYHFENALHFNISDWLARHLNPAVMSMTHASASQLFQNATYNSAQKNYKFSDKDYASRTKAGAAAAAARLKQMDSNASLAELKEEMAQAEAREQSLKDARSQAYEKISELKKQVQPITPQEEARYKAALADWQKQREQEYVQAKLAEKHDLSQGLSQQGPDARQKDTLKELARLEQHYGGKLNPAPTDKTDYEHSLGVQESVYRSISVRIAGGSPPPADRNAAAIPVAVAAGAAVKQQADLKQIEKLIEDIAADRTELSTSMTMKQAVEKLLDAEAHMRQTALDQRRNGQGMENFQQSLSQVDSVMQLALSQNELNAALTAIGQMQTAINNKNQTINQSITQDQANLQQVEQLLSQEQQQWTQQVNQEVSAANQSQSDMQGTQTEVNDVVSAVQNFSQSEKSLLASINAADGGASGNALTEIARRLAIIQSGQAAQWETSGGNPNVTFTLNQLNGYLQEINTNITTATQGLATLEKTPLQFAETTIYAVPGPAVSVPPNPTTADLQAILTQRQAYWTSQLATYTGLETTIKQMQDPNNQAMTQNLFGDSEPQSLPVWKNQEQTVLSQGQAKITTDAQQMDQLATAINAAFGSNLPMLSGMTLSQLQSEVQTYANDLTSIKPPAGTSAATVEAEMDMVSLAYLMSDLGNQVINASLAQQTITSINSALSTTLPQAAQGMAAIVQMVDNILADVKMDQAYVAGDQETPQQLLTRKVNLLQNEILPPLQQQALPMLQNDLIPYQQQTIAQYQNTPNSTSNYEYLYTTEQSFITQIENLYNTTMPWSIETFGGTPTNKSSSLQDLSAWKSELDGYLNGYTDSTGAQQQGLLNALQEAKDRMNPNFNGDSSFPATENVYGEVQPYSLPQKISKYTTEMQLRAGQINQNDAQINQMIQEIKTLSNGQYDLTKYILPVGVQPNAAGVATITNLANSNLLPQFGTALQTVANEAQAAASGGTNINLGGGSGTVPTGTQPSPTVSNDDKIALLASQIGPLLAPAGPSATTAINPQAGDTTDAVARFLYSNGVVGGAQTGEQFITSTVFPFVHDGIKTINGALTDVNTRVNYINSGGTSLSQAQVYAEEIKVFTSLGDYVQKATTFFGQYANYDSQSLSTISSIISYYQSLETIDQAGITAAQGQLQADQTISQALQAEQTKLQNQLSEVNGWMSQLDSPYDSALRRTSDAISALQDQTKQVLLNNIKYKDLQQQLHDANAVIQAKAGVLEDEQNDLMSQVQTYDAAHPDAPLPQKDVQAITKLKYGQNMWEQQDADGSYVVVPKSKYPAFVQALLKTIAPQDSNDAINQFAQALVSNPQDLMSLIPGSQVMNFGGADGFYMVYQTTLSIPNGVSTGNMVILGNVAKIFGNNISVNAYQFESPDDPGNAPWGDKGLGVQVESLQGKNWVNYLNIDLHRFGFDVPSSDAPSAQAQEDRLEIFDDYAFMAMGGKLYVGLAGFGDAALDNPQNNPYYYGGNLKTSIQMTPVASLTAQQQELFANDPRDFLEEVNLDFTGDDPTLNQNYEIAAQGDSKDFSRTTIGPDLNLAKLFDSKGDPDAFTLSLYYDRINGTDDISQSAVGATVLKGLSIRKAGQPWVKITNSMSAEAGQQYNMVSDNLSINLPKGIVMSANGQIMSGDQAAEADQIDGRAYYGQISKKMGSGSQVQIGYGSPVIGMENRLYLTMNSGFSLNQIWSTVSRQAVDDVRGGDALKPFSGSLTKFISQDSSGDQASAELQKVFKAYAAEELTESKTIGDLSNDIETLRKAGALMDNTRVESVLGFVSGGVSNDSTELAVGGGPVAGTETVMTLSKTQKALVADETTNLVRDGLGLQDLMVGLAQKFQGAVKDVVEAQGELSVAQAAVSRLPEGPEQDEAQVRVDQAQDKLNQAIIRFNVMTGRNPDTKFPLDSANGATIEDLMGQLKQVITTPEGLTDVLHQIDPDKLQAKIGTNPFNILDKIPWVERLTFNVGTQLQDAMANQLVGIGGSVRLPIYDPASKEKDKAYVLENKAAVAEITQVYQDHARAMEKQLLEGELAGAQYQTLQPHLTQASQDLTRTAAAYRNGLAGPDELQKAYQSWMWYYDTYNDALAAKTLADASTSLAGNFLSPGADWNGVKSLMGADSPALDITSLDQAANQAFAHSGSLEEMAAREQAAQAMMQDASHRMQKVYLDLSIGSNLVAGGTSWLPTIGVTGFPVMPIFTFQFEPSDLKALDQAQHKEQSAYYAAVQGKLKDDLASDLYQDILMYQASIAELSQFNDVIIPGLQNALARAKGDAAASDAQYALDQAQLQRQQILYSGAQALTSVNMLLGRSPSSPLDIEVAPNAALASLQEFYQKSQSPAQIQSEILDSQVQITRAAETIADRGEKVQDLSVEPVSLIVRAGGRLLRDLSGNGLGDADLKEQALLENLEAQRAQESFQKNLPVQRAQIAEQIQAVQGEINSLPSGNGDGQSAVKRVQLEAGLLMLQAQLARLGAPSPAAGASPVPVASATMPGSFAELRNRLEAAEQGVAAQPDPQGVGPANPQVSETDPQSFERYYYARQTLGQTQLHQGYVETWLEARLKSSDTSPQELLRLEKLRENEADESYKTQESAVAVNGDILAADFAAKVETERFIEARIKNLGFGPKDQRQAAEALSQTRQGIESDAAQITALLGLPANTSADKLAGLVPNQAGDARSIGQNLISQLDNQSFSRIQNDLFSGHVPTSAINYNATLDEIRTDVLLKNMSSSGITPVAAFGIFRGQAISGLFLQTPDPTSVENGLENVLSQAMVDKLKASGELRDLSLHLSQLLQSVHDDAVDLESRRRLVQSSQAQYENILGESGDPQSLSEVQAAQNEMIQAWLSFNDKAAKSKSDLIELSAEIKALDLDKDIPPDVSAAADDNSTPEPFSGASTLDLMTYWSDRMSAPDFVQSQEKILDDMGQGQLISQAFKDRLLSDAQAWSQAKAAEQKIRAENLPADQQEQLLVNNDAAGKRQAVTQDLSKLLDAVNSIAQKSRPGANPDPTLDLMTFLEGDLDAQAKAAHDERINYNTSVEGVRKAFWDSMDMPPALSGSFLRLESLQESLRSDWQNLLNDYLAQDAHTKNGEGSTPFILRDADLDAYLQDQHAFNQEIVALLKSDDVQNNDDILQGLESLYDVSTALDQETQSARYGRGMAALDALIELDQVRLSVARWENNSPDDIAAASRSLGDLNSMKQRWLDGKDSLEPIYAVIPVGRDLQPVSGVQNWVTQDQVTMYSEQQHSVTRVADADGKLWKLYWTTEVKSADGKVEKEVFLLEPGVDLAQYGLGDGGKQYNGVNAATEKAREDNSLVELGQSNFDFVPEGAQNANAGGYTADTVFGLTPPPKDAPKPPTFFFFAAPASDTPRALAAAPVLTEAQALQESPHDYVVYAYTGHEPLSYDRFPTLGSFKDYLESLKDSPERKDEQFQRLYLTKAGTNDMKNMMGNRAAASLRRGWISLKLDSYGFSTDAKEQVNGVYQDQDAFNAAIDKFKNADANAVAAQAALARDTALAQKAGQIFTALGNDYKAKEKEYKKALDARAQEITAVVSGKMHQKSGESAESYNKRVASKVADELKTDKQYAGLKKHFAVYTDAFNKEKLKYEAAKTQLDNDNTALYDAKAIQTQIKNKQTPRFYRSDELDLKLDVNGTLVAVQAPAVFGGAELKWPIDSNGTKDQAGADIKGSDIRGPLYAAVLDNDGRVVSSFQTPDEVEKAAQSWTMRGVVMHGEDAAIESNGEIKTDYRLDYYVDPAAGPNGLPVELSARYLRDKIQQDKKGLFARQHWGVMPQNWLNMMMEVPNEIIGTPIEISGRDPQQEHYLGRINMNHEAGGETERYGFFREAAGKVDFLDLLPDPVNIFDDPSQLPAEALVSSPVLPGQDIYSKSLRVPGKKGDNVRLGALSAAQGLRHSLEDLTDAQTQTLSYFQGGYEDLIISRVHGRNGTYEESTRQAGAGDGAVKGKVMDARSKVYDPIAAADPHSAMEGLVESANPDNVLTDRVEQVVTVNLGAEQYDQASHTFDRYSSEILGEIQKAKASLLGTEQTPGDQQVLDDSKNILANALAVRDSAQKADAKSWNEYHALDSLIETQDALQQAIASWQQRANELGQEIKDAQSQVDQERAKLNQAARAIPSALAAVSTLTKQQAVPAAPAAPKNPNQTAWPWIIMLAGILSLLSAAWGTLRRRFFPGRID